MIKMNPIEITIPPERKSLLSNEPAGIKDSLPPHNLSFHTETGIIFEKVEQPSCKPIIKGITAGLATFTIFELIRIILF